MQNFLDCNLSKKVIMKKGGLFFGKTFFVIVLNNDNNNKLETIPLDRENLLCKHLSMPLFLAVASLPIQKYQWRVVHRSLEREMPLEKYLFLWLGIKSGGKKKECWCQ